MFITNIKNKLYNYIIMSVKNNISQKLKKNVISIFLNTNYLSPEESLVFLNEYKNSKEIILEVVKENGIKLENASSILQNDNLVVLTAVKNDGFALYYVSYKFQMENMSAIVYAVHRSGINVLSCAPHDNYLVEKTISEYISEDYDDNLRIHLKYYNDHLREHTYHNIYIHIKENIKTHENFLIFLHGVCVPRSQTILQKHGYFHSIDFLKLIAKFTGFINVNDYHVYKSVFKQISLLLC
jgi:hypothetical protein